MSARLKAAPDGLMAAVLLSFLATAGLFYVNIMPALVDGLQSGLKFSARDAGLVASANIYGAALGALAAVFFVRRLHWRAAAVTALLGLVAIDLTSMMLLARPLMALRFLDGVVGGFLVGTSYGVIARTKAPDRVFGVLLVVQFGLGGLSVMLLPRLVPRFGAPVLFAALIAFSLVTLGLSPFLDDYRIAGPGAEAPPVGRLGAAWRPMAAALGAIFLFQAANEGLAAYILGLGRAYGLTTAAASTAVGVATWTGALGSVLVAVLGLKFGRARPLLIGLLLAIAGNAGLLGSAVPGLYLAANTLSSIAWSFSIAYLLGLCAAFDRTGRSAALGGFFSKLGLASGPALYAVLLEERHFERIVLISLAGLVACLMLALWPARKLDRGAVERVP